MSNGKTLLDLLRPYVDASIVEQLVDLGSMVPRVAELLDDTSDFCRFELKALVAEHRGEFLGTVLEGAMRAQVRSEAPAPV